MKNNKRILIEGNIQRWIAIGNVETPRARPHFFATWPVITVLTGYCGTRIVACRILVVVASFSDHEAISLLGVCKYFLHTLIPSAVRVRMCMVPISADRSQ